MLTRCVVLVQEGIQTLSVRVGVPRVFWLCIVLLEVAYAGAICMGLYSTVSFCRFIMTHMCSRWSPAAMPALNSSWGRTCA